MSSYLSLTAPSDPALVAQEAQVNSDGTRISFTVPGVEPEDFSCFGTISAWKLMKQFSITRAVAMMRKGFCFNEALDDEHTIFLVYSDLETKPSLFERATARRMWMPICLTMELVSIGRSTLNLRCFLHEGDKELETDNWLAQCFFTSVRVNVKTRRSSHFPPTFLERYSKQRQLSSIPRGPPTATSAVPTSGLGNVPDLGRSDTPESTSPDSQRQLLLLLGECEFVVRPSDCDFNKHMSNFSYIRFCLDTIALLQQRHQASSMTSHQHRASSADDIVMHRVKRIRTRYLGESRLGDVISVTTHRDARCSHTLHFRLSRDDVVLCETILVFHDSVTNLFATPQTLKAKI